MGLHPQSAVGWHLCGREIQLRDFQPYHRGDVRIYDSPADDDLRQGALRQATQDRPAPRPILVAGLRRNLSPGLDRAHHARLWLCAVSGNPWRSRLCLAFVARQQTGGTETGRGRGHCHGRAVSCRACRVLGCARWIQSARLVALGMDMASVRGKHCLRLSQAGTTRIETGSGSGSERVMADGQSRLPVYFIQSWAHLSSSAGCNLIPQFVFVPFLFQWLETIWGITHPSIGWKPTRIGVRQLIVSTIWTILFIVCWRL